ncbi:uncharacterized protein CMU_031160 [Cryptosporidium muris RN66]|uniref:Uncharacterized protein n=1 Tax=Cryptosporidium muris (strain RN66) TaxID=441375 RepID=B6AID4_CRYMR|nr:uncharacterized protein CMU_031160 [Cryptosporidium muris RN66]EEA07975.1 hypothetical protein, conserved [Cryptosporidium muris RN66]|eukprot:XP_002142324.1 hypothetical protein [Cryptosporidium muris RN66]
MSSTTVVKPRVPTRARGERVYKPGGKKEWRVVFWTHESNKPSRRQCSFSEAKYGKEAASLLSRAVLDYIDVKGVIPDDLHDPPILDPAKKELIDYYSALHETRKASQKKIRQRSKYKQSQEESIVPLYTLTQSASLTNISSKKKLPLLQPVSSLSDTLVYLMNSKDNNNMSNKSEIEGIKNNGDNSLSTTSIFSTTSSTSSVSNSSDKCSLSPSTSPISIATNHIIRGSNTDSDIGLVDNIYNPGILTSFGNLGNCNISNAEHVGSQFPITKGPSYIDNSTNESQHENFTTIANSLLNNLSKNVLLSGNMMSPLNSLINQQYPTALPPPLPDILSNNQLPLNSELQLFINQTFQQLYRNQFSLINMSNFQHIAINNLPIVSIQGIDTLKTDQQSYIDPFFKVRSPATNSDMELTKSNVNSSLIKETPDSPKPV